MSIWLVRRLWRILFSGAGAKSKTRNAWELFERKRSGGKADFRVSVGQKKYVIEENEAEIVRKLFSDYMDGKISKELVEWLKNSGVRTHRGKVFSFGRVSEMLRNPKYIGKCSYGGTIYENIVPPIIEKTCFIVCRKDCQKTHSNRGERVRARNSFWAGSWFVRNAGSWW